MALPLVAVLTLDASTFEVGLLSAAVTVAYLLVARWTTWGTLPLGALTAGAPGSALGPGLAGERPLSSGPDSP